MDVPASASATHPEHHHQAQPAASPAAARFFAARLSLLACARLSALVGPGLPQCSTCLERAPAFPATRPHLAQASGFGVAVGAAAGARGAAGARSAAAGMSSSLSLPSSPESCAGSRTASAIGAKGPGSAAVPTVTPSVSGGANGFGGARSRSACCSS